MPAAGVDVGALPHPPCAGCGRPLVRVDVPAHVMADPQRGGAPFAVAAYAYWRHLPTRRRAPIMAADPAPVHRLPGGTLAGSATTRLGPSPLAVARAILTVAGLDPDRIAAAFGPTVIGSAAEA
jgi:hypothetical protein